MHAAVPPARIQPRKSSSTARVQGPDALLQDITSILNTTNSIEDKIKNMLIARTSYDDDCLTAREKSAFIGQLTKLLQHAGWKLEAVKSTGPFKSCREWVWVPPEAQNSSEPKLNEDYFDSERRLCAHLKQEYGLPLTSTDTTSTEERPRKSRSTMLANLEERKSKPRSQDKLGASTSPVRSYTLTCIAHSREIYALGTPKKAEAQHYVLKLPRAVAQGRFPPVYYAYCAKTRSR
jgi:hypothetical protein